MSKDKNIKNEGSCSSYNQLEKLKFMIPSFIGVILFMCPISTAEGITIPIAILSNGLKHHLGSILPTILLVLVLITAAGTAVTKLLKPGFIVKNRFLNSLFDVTPIWSILRFLAAIFTVMVYTNQGIPFLISSNTGGLVFSDLLPILFSVFLFAGLFLPLLLNFGLLEFVGSLLSKVMRPIFNLPGRSAVDCIASWLGDGTIGVLLTSKQYEDGFYTKREAAVIGTTFSLVSVTFSLVVINTVNLGHMFIPFYITVTIASLLAAIILPKMPPLSKKEDVFFNVT